MTSPSKTDPRFPTGPFKFDPDVTPEKRTKAIAAIRETPAALRAAIRGLTDAQIETPYRDGGWTVRQVVHHVPESHMNAFVRFKLALTEYNPTIRPYKEDLWVRLGDVPRTPIETSLVLLDVLHQRWVTLLETMKEIDFERPLVHPDIGQITLDRLLQTYAWHGAHHVAHITTLRSVKGW
ncbi:MAG TPA: putative metal-dependent hydrolase [Vicinamibacterales bacterium]|nr:putative metal-dependent hydrolase [Vicinamibacterales bacterium]